ncbi:MAG: GNAT family N-acetyltransferase [Thermotogota bacterium]
MVDFIYKPYEDKYLDKVAKTFIEVFSKEPWNDRWPSIEKAKEYLKGYIDAPNFKGFLVLNNKDHIIAFSFGDIRKWWSGDEYMIHEYGVSPSFQGEGFGVAFMDYIQRELIKKGVRVIILNTGKGTPAEYFYKKEGFEENEDNIFLYKVIR